MPDAFDALIAELASRQGGHITTQQLLDIGLGLRAIQTRSERGNVIRVHRPRRDTRGVGRGDGSAAYQA